MRLYEREISIVPSEPIKLANQREVLFGKPHKYSAAKTKPTMPELLVIKHDKASSVDVTPIKKIWQQANTFIFESLGRYLKAEARIPARRKAEVLGLGRETVFLVVLPLVRPALLAVALFSFTASWNEFLYAFVFTSSSTSRTLTVGLTLMLGEDVFYWGKMMAGALLTALPPVIMYTLAQRLVIQGLTSGGVKG